MYDAVVVGGGIVGSSVAYHLARAGVETLLVDREEDGRATDAGAGILSPATSSRTASDAWFEFAVEAVDYYPDLVSSLSDEQEGETGYERCGLLSVAIEEAEVEAFDRATERIERRQRALGRPAPDSFAEISPDEARERFPPLAEADVERAAYYEEAARVDGRLLTDALRRAGKAHGLDLWRADAERLRIEDGAITGVVTDDGTVETTAAVVAGGAWSSEFGDQLGVEIPVEPQRGQIAHLGLGESDDAGNGGSDEAGDGGGEGEADTADWPIVSAFRGHYLVPWADDRVAAGATRETGSGFVPRTTAGGVREVLDEALRVAPGLADAEVEEVRVGLRPVSEDRLPILGEVPEVEGAYVATGHGATGLQLGPYSGTLVAEMVQGQEPETDISQFGVGRFS